MSDCIFCKIVNGEIPSYTIYENDYVKVFLDINPMSDGHTLIIPKKHFESIMDIDKEYLMEIENTSMLFTRVLCDVLNADGVTRMQNNGYGQDVKHYHMHLIPRYKNNDVKYQINSKSKKDVSEIFNKLK